MKRSSHLRKNTNIRKSRPWNISYNRFEPAEEGLREAIFALGNGYFAIRAAAPEATASKIHYPGTYVAGLYNRLKTTIAGKTIVNEDLVNCPNWVFLTFKIGSEEWFCPSTSRILSYKQTLNIRSGILNRKVRFQNTKGQRTYVETNRIVSMDDPHCAAMEYIIIPENYSEWITIRTMLDGTILNTGVERYRQLNSKHWKPLDLGKSRRNGIYLSMKTSWSHIEIAEACRTRVFSGNREIKPKMRHLMKGKERIGQEFRFFARQRSHYRIEKAVSLYTSKDQGVGNPLEASLRALDEPLRFSNILKLHQRAWESLWAKFDIQIAGDAFSQKVLRLHIFHLLQTASGHRRNIDWGIPARGLHGEAYRGHIFWDEMFVTHLYDLHLPGVTRASLMYRYKRLNKARQYARKEGYKGAMFPWQSGSSGREETQIVHLNPLSGKWGPDYSRRQRHISFSIVYNVWNYWRKTGDFGFLIRYGAEIILSVARFFSNLAKYDKSDSRYHISGVMGPDEFHEKLPGSNRPGLKDNAYTNLMTVWTLLKAQEVIKILPKGHKKRIIKKLKIEQKELYRWDDIVHKMNIIINKGGIISQFDGYFGLKELDWQGYRNEYGNIHRMDRILKAEGKSPDAYKVAKQADVLMVFYLLQFSELEDIFKRLGYPFDKRILRRNHKYYIKRTSHGSTLSKVTHSYIALMLNKPKEARRMFKDILESDIYDVQGGTTPEGIHVGVMGGSVEILTRGFCGLNFTENKIILNPRIPKDWKKVKFKVLYKNIWFTFTFRQNSISVLTEGQISLPIEVKGRSHYPLLGKKLTVTL